MVNIEVRSNSNMGTRGKLRMCQFKQPLKYIHTHTAPTDKSAGDPPPQILISISATNLMYILHNVRRHTRMYVCTHYAAW